MSPTFSTEEIERMRAMIAAHDKANEPQEFDINNPPVKPYVFKEFPRAMYHHGQRKIRKAMNAAEMETALEAGWSKEPFPAEIEEAELDPEAAAEVAAVESRRKKRQ